MIFIIFAIIAVAAFVIFRFTRAKSLFKNKKPIEVAKSAKSLEACVLALNKFKFMENFAPEIEVCEEQIKRFYSKKENAKDILKEKFSETEITFAKFMSVLDGVEGVMYINFRSIVNKISVFDYEEYKQIKNLEFSKDTLAEEKMQIYNSYISYVDKATKDNEEILLKLDRLLLEISHYSEVEIADIMDMPAMKDLDELIKNAKLYR